ncbi:MAG: lamin tail domain-containing protein [Candidatus Pacebacteria bacterium]|nr:lamin tail domain-containing protein [Candidatus Paceibacterota bacterium]
MSFRSIRNVVIFFLFLANFVFAKEIIINEIAWMGTENNSNDEWIELYNNTNQEINLDNYKLIIGTKEISLEGKINANDFYLLERTDDSTLPNIKADLIYTGSLKNTGVKIQLKKNNDIIDEADFENGWNFGNNETKQTAERIEENWQTSLDKGGSPKKENIKTVLPSLDENSSIEIEKENKLPINIIALLSLTGGILAIFTRRQLS